WSSTLSGWVVEPMRRPPTARPTAPARQGTSALFRDRGAVTAETAVVLPGLALLLGVALCCVHAAAAHVACVDAARVGPARSRAATTRQSSAPLSPRPVPRRPRRNCPWRKVSPG